MFVRVLGGGALRARSGVPLQDGGREDGAPVQE